MAQNTASSALDYERLADLTDSRLTGFYHELGLLTADPERCYDVNEVLGLVRTAFWAGAREHRNDRAGLDGLLEECRASTAAAV